MRIDIHPGRLPPAGWVTGWVAAGDALATAWGVGGWRQWDNRGWREVKEEMRCT